jgi:hypothetical protein
MPLSKLLSYLAALSNPPFLAIFSKKGVNILLIDNEVDLAYLAVIFGTQ